MTPFHYYFVLCDGDDLYFDETFVRKLGQVFHRLALSTLKASSENECKRKGGQEERGRTSSLKFLSLAFFLFSPRLCHRSKVAYGYTKQDDRIRPQYNGTFLKALASSSLIAFTCKLNTHTHVGFVKLPFNLVPRPPTVISAQEK